jgi:GTPase SAR1 family protein
VGHSRTGAVSVDGSRLLPLADAAVIVFDLPCPDTFRNVSVWIETVEAKAPPGIVIAVLGNKLDLVEHPAVMPQDIIAWQSEYGHSYWETSARDGVGIGDAFAWLAKQLCERPLNHIEQPMDLMDKGADRYGCCSAGTW